MYSQIIEERFNCFASRPRGGERSESTRGRDRRVTAGISCSGFIVDPNGFITTSGQCLDLDLGAGQVIDTLAQRCPSTAMVYLMHLCGVACYAAAPDKTASLLQAAAAGRHLSTLAFSEKGSRSHFWAPVSRASGSGNGAVSISAQKSFVTSAGHADGYARSLVTGLWPSLDVLPPAERAATGRKLRPRTVRVTPQPMPARP